MRSLECRSCRKMFTPKEGGYNARYCTDTCKRRVQRARLRERNPEAIKIRRARSYLQTKLHPTRYVKHLENSKSSVRKVRAWLANYKLEHGCVDCGYRAHPAALQLDHEGPKAVEIAEARSSIRRLQAEIESGKCRVRCANCHSIKTWQRKQRPNDTGSVGPGCDP